MRDKLAIHSTTPAVQGDSNARFIDRRGRGAPGAPGAPGERRNAPGAIKVQAPGFIRESKVKNCARDARASRKVSLFQASAFKQRFPSPGAPHPLEPLCLFLTVLIQAVAIASIAIFALDFYDRLFECWQQAAHTPQRMPMSEPELTAPGGAVPAPIATTPAPTLQPVMDTKPSKAKPYIKRM